MRILFIGGTGVISSACSELALQRGHELVLLNRGQSTRQLAVNAGAKLTVLQADIRRQESVLAALGDLQFDAVVDWIAFTPEHVQNDLELFRDRTRQYVFISSASAYQTPPRFLPVTESTPLHNPCWKYSRDKAACEALLSEAYRREGFPVTVVRPSHTYDPTLLPFHDGYTTVARMRAGKKVVVHGDGTSLWTLTHHRDFAVGLVGLLGNPHAIGETFHITSDEWLSWNQIYEILAHAAGVEAKLVHVPSEWIAAFDAEWGASLLGDKAHSMIFDNSKIRRLVPEFRPVIPFWQGAREIIAWYDADPAHQVVDPAMDSLQDRIITTVEGTDALDRGTSAAGLVLHFNQALNAGDVEAMMRLMTDDCVFENTTPAPDGMRYAGKPAVRAFWEEFFRNSRQPRIDAEEVISQGDRCVLRWVYHWQDAAGRPSRVRGVDVYRIRNGLIQEKLSYVKG